MLLKVGVQSSGLPSESLPSDMTGTISQVSQSKSVGLGELVALHLHPVFRSHSALQKINYLCRIEQVTYDGDVFLLIPKVIEMVLQSCEGQRPMSISSTMFEENLTGMSVTIIFWHVMK